MNEFSVRVPGKWIFAGEHSVLRGKKALAFPMDQFALELKFTPNEKDHLEINTPGNTDQEIQIIRTLTDRCFGDSVPQGVLSIESTIPMGAGLGSSAALCVAFAKWRSHVNPQYSILDEIQWATDLENQFHGKSSGLDVAVIAHQRPILFSMKDGAEVLDLDLSGLEFFWKDSGLRGFTTDCIRHVQEWCKANADQVEEVDQKMEAAVLSAVDAFHQKQEIRKTQLGAALNQAFQCFEAWGLITPELSEQRNQVLTPEVHGLKLTGAGLGGFWVGLR